MPITISGSNTPTLGGVAYGDGTNLAFTAVGGTGLTLTSAGSAIPAWTTGTVTLLANTAAPYFTGGNYTWTITNYDSATAYTVTTTNGSVSQTNSTVTYTPSTGGAGGFVINGRAISVTVTAFPALSAGTAANFASGQQAGIISMARLTATTAVIVYCSYANDGLYAVVASVSGTTVTYGSTVLIRSNFSPTQASICALSSTLCLVGYETTASNHFGAKTLSISGTTITVNAEVTNGITSTNIVMCALTATTALAMYYSSLVVISVSGTTPSFGTAVSTGLTANYKSISPLSSTKAIILYDGTSSYPTANVVSVSGTTVTIGSALVIQSVGTGQITSVIALSDTTAIAQMTGAASVVQVAPLTISGTTVTAGSVSSLTAAQIYSSPQAAAYINAASGVALYQNAAGAGVGVAAIYGASTLATGSVTTLVATTDTTRMTGIYLDTNKILLAYTVGIANGAARVITVS